MNAAEIRPALTVLAKVLQGATAEQMQWKPAPERWSVSEGLAHRAEVERVFRDRAQRIAEQELPPIASYDQEEAYRRGENSSGRAEEHLQRFHLEREATLQLLRALPDAALARRGLHSEFGELRSTSCCTNGRSTAWATFGRLRSCTGHRRSIRTWAASGAYYTVKP